jgi:hypothetical protein
VYESAGVKTVTATVVPTAGEEILTQILALRRTLVHLAARARTSSRLTRD